MICTDYMYTIRSMCNIIVHCVCVFRPANYKLGVDVQCVFRYTANCVTS